MEPGPELCASKVWGFSGEARGTLPFGKGGAATAAGIRRAISRRPEVCCANFGSFFAQRAKKARWRSRPISRVLSWTVIPLGAPSPIRSSNLPGPDAGHVMRSLFGLAPGGVCRAGLLPGSRCALTAPFHPCRPACAVLGGIFLLHFPSARAAQALPGTLPCGARTFLGTLAGDATVWPTPPRALSHTLSAGTAKACATAHPVAAFSPSFVVHCAMRL